MKGDMRVFFVLLAALATLALGACGQEQSIETPAGTVSVAEDSGNIEVKGPDGTVHIKGTEKAGEIKVKTAEGEELDVAYGKDSLVAGFPKEIPIYAPSHVTMSQLLKDNNAMATLSTPDGPAKVVQFYKNSMTANGWSMEGEMSMGGITVLQGKKGSQMLNVSVAETESETTIALALTQESAQ